MSSHPHPSLYLDAIPISFSASSTSLYCGTTKGDIVQIDTVFHSATPVGKVCIGGTVCLADLEVSTTRVALTSSRDECASLAAAEIEAIPIPVAITALAHCGGGEEVVAPGSPRPGVRRQPPSSPTFLVGTSFGRALLVSREDALPAGTSGGAKRKRGTDPLSVSLVTGRGQTLTGPAERPAWGSIRTIAMRDSVSPDAPVGSNLLLGTSSGIVLVAEEDGSFTSKRVAASPITGLAVVGGGWLAASADGSLTLVRENGSTRRWLAETGDEVTHARATPGRRVAQFLAVSPVRTLVVVDDKVWAGLDSGRIAVFDRHTWLHLRTLSLDGNTSGIVSVTAWRSVLVAVSASGAIFLVDRRTLLTHSVLSAQVEADRIVTCAHLAPGAPVLVIGSTTTLRSDGVTRSGGACLHFVDLPAVPEGGTSRPESPAPGSQQQATTAVGDPTAEPPTVQSPQLLSQWAGAVLASVTTEAGLVRGLRALVSAFVAIPSVSANQSAQGRLACVAASKWLQSVLTGLGFTVHLVPSAAGPAHLPLIIARLSASPGASVDDETAGPVAVYSHYDVVPADDEGWTSEPFVPSLRDGFLYGRGVTDNKGPCLAIALAAASLAARGSLTRDVVMLVEGEEETGSMGTLATIREHRELVSPGGKSPAALLVSNNYWLDDEHPALTYGLRGIIRGDITVVGAAQTVHSGTDGGVLVEPLADVANVVAALRTLPLDEDVTPFTEEERQRFADLGDVFSVADYKEKMGTNVLSCGESVVEVLRRRWREPSLSVLRIGIPHSATESSGCKAGGIPRVASATVSIRTVPNQSVSEVAARLEAHIAATVASLGTPNTVTFSLDRAGDHWLGDPTSPVYQAAARSVASVWGTDPVIIREGGSLPILAALERELACPALIIPLGLSSDAAHLPNERMAMKNLVNGYHVVARFLGESF